MATTMPTGTKLVLGFYAISTGVKKGTRGRVRPVGDVLTELEKGDARKLRKALHRAGYAELAATPRPVFVYGEDLAGALVGPFPSTEAATKFIAAEIAADRATPGTDRVVSLEEAEVIRKTRPMMEYTPEQYGTWES